MPAGADPDNVVRKAGRDGLAALLAEAVDFVAFVSAGRVPFAVADQRKLLAELVALLKAISDPATRELYANRVAAMFKVEKRVLLSGGAARPAPVKARPNRPELEEQLAAAVVLDAGLARTAADLGLTEMLEDEELRSIVEIALTLCGDDGYGPAMLLDRFEDEERRRRIAGWTLSSRHYRAQTSPGPGCSGCVPPGCTRQILTTENAEQAERLMREREGLLQRAARGGQVNEEHGEEE